jgi:pilus assembly protein CpaB
MRRSIYSLIIGIIFAGVALWLLFTQRSPQESAEAAVPAIPTVQVLVASKDIPYGEKISAESVAVVDWPATSVPKDAILTRVELLEGPDAPRIALRAFAANEPFLKAKISGFGERPILSRKVAEGMRAYTVRINDVSGVGGFILPGDHVDIMLTRQIDDGFATDMILQNVTVLGIDQISSETAQEPVLARSATFEVTPEQAQKLALASQVGTLSLALRNYATMQTEKTTQIEAGDLGEKKAAPAPVRQAPPPRDTSIYVNVRKGTAVEQEKVAH